MNIREKVTLAISRTGTIPVIEAYRLADAAITALFEAAAEPNERGVSWHMQPASRDNRRDRKEAALKFEWDK